jgi:hypothetical protein
MADTKTQDKNKDVKFSREELTDTDGAVSAEALEKRNSPMPEKYREDQTGLGDWPVHEGRKPAAMPADKQDSLDYKLATYDKVDEDQRAMEVEGIPGDAARVAFRKAVREAGPGADMNEIQAPPSRNAQLAAEGAGAESSPVPILDPANPNRLATPSLANPTIAEPATRTTATRTAADKK